MKFLDSFFAKIFQKKYLVPLLVIIVLFALIAGTINFWPLINDQLVQTQVNTGKIMTGLSKLVISPAYANNEFSFKPEMSDSLGVDAGSIYTLSSQEPFNASVIEKSLKIEPAIKFKIEKVSDFEWRIIPQEIVPANTLLKASINTEYVNADNQTQAREFSWVYQIKDSFKVVRTIPGRERAQVPLDTGIEITFSHDNYKDYEKYFAVNPKVEGKFEKHGRTLVFVPTNQLQAGTVYAVTVKKDLPLENSADKLAEDYVFIFETYPENNINKQDGWSFYQQIFEFSSLEKPIIPLYANRQSGKSEADVALYKFNDWQNYLASMKKRDQLPWWSYAREKFQEDISKLNKIAEFKQTVKDSGKTKYIEFPEILGKGFYLAEFKNDKNKQQIWLQVSDLSAYFNETITKSLFWVNDLRTKMPASGVDIQLVGIEEIYATDNQGIAEFATPKILSEIAGNFDKLDVHYFKLQKDENVLILPASNNSRAATYPDANPSYNYWNYLYTNKPLYRPDDTVKFWGMLKARNNQTITNASIVLSKAGYVDYYYRPVEISKQAIALSESGIFSGTINLSGLRPDYYTLELKVGKDTIYTGYINISNYIKPAYQIELTPEKTHIYAGDTVKLTGRASFFEGTPLPNLKLIYTTSAGDKKITTDQNGEVQIEYKKEYANCTNEYSCWSGGSGLSLRPEDSEMAELGADAYINILGPDVYLRTETKYLTKGKAEVKLSTKKYNIDALNNLDQKKIDNPDPAPSVKIEAEIIRTKYIKHEAGTYYDFISKKTYKSYNYERRDESLKKDSLITDSKGEYLYALDIEPETSYKIIFKTFDNKNRYDVQTAYLYYYNGISLYSYNSYDYNYYHFIFDQDKISQIDDEVTAKLLNKDDLMPEGQSKYLYLQTQNGLQEYVVANSAIYKFKFEERDVPNINLTGIYFNGETYNNASEAYWSNPLRYDFSEKKLNIEIRTDKAKYLPGEEISLAVTVVDQNNKPQEADINLNLVDEALYALMESSASPLESLYRSIGSGELFSGESHVPVMDKNDGAEKGGCFAAGTKIRMADGTEETIENLRAGDKILTYANPLTHEKTAGQIVKVFEHMVAGYLLVNGKLKVTPEHLVFANGRFQEAGSLRIGDWMLSGDGLRITVDTLSFIAAYVRVYNITVSPQHTFFADGFYVHNEKGGGPRENFVDNVLFENTRTNVEGKAVVKLKLPDNITSWRVTIQGITADLLAGDNTVKVPVSLPVFADVSIGNEYLNDDLPVAKMRAFGTALKLEDKAEFIVKAPELGIRESTPLSTTAFKAAYFDFPRMQTGDYKIIYELKTDKGNDAVKFPLKVIDSRLMAQSAVSEKLTTTTQIKAINNYSISIVLSDQGQNQLYPELLNLAWSWGDRVDERLTRVEARKLLEKYYQEKFEENISAWNNYQNYSGGISLLPYSDPDLELSARIAASDAAVFDQISLKQYFFHALEAKLATPEEASLALAGLASLGEPVLPRITEWLQRKDLTVVNRLYLAEGLLNLGAKEFSLSVFKDLLAKNSEKKGAYLFIKFGKTQDDVFLATALAGSLAAKLDLPEKQALHNYVIDNQVIWGEEKNSENLYSLEKSEYLKSILPTFNPTQALVVYELSGQRHEVKITGGETYAFQADPHEAADLKFVSVTGEVGVSSRYITPLNLKSVVKSPDISLKREYFVNGVRTTFFHENDLVEVRLYPKFGETSLAGDYQITDILPSGLAPATKVQTSVRYYDCKYWFPYNTDGQIVKYMLNKDWKSYYCGSDYIYYMARVKNSGEYKAEAAVLQSFVNPEAINYSDSETIKIAR